MLFNSVRRPFLSASPSKCSDHRRLHDINGDHLSGAVGELRKDFALFGSLFDIGSYHADGKPAYDYNFVHGKMSDMHGQVFRGHIGGDKFSARASNNKTNFYARHLVNWATDPSFSILEIGVFRGESLATWQAVFCNASVIGVDGNLRPFYAHLPKLRELGAFNKKMPILLEGDSIDEEGPISKVKDNTIDVIVDDGCHLPSCQVATCRPDVATSCLHAI